jgi:hypothetical protein
VGTVTRPWEPDVPPVAAPAFAGRDDFLAFDRPGFTKVALGLRADPYERGACLLTVHARVVSTDDASRRRFRHYWRSARPFDALICRLALRRVARDLAPVDRRAGAGSSVTVGSRLRTRVRTRPHS